MNASVSVSVSVSVCVCVCIHSLYVSVSTPYLPCFVLLSLSYLHAQTTFQGRMEASHQTVFKNANVLLEYVDCESGAALCMCISEHNPSNDELEFISLECASRKYGSRDPDVNIVLMELYEIRKEFFKSSVSRRPPPQPTSDDPVYDDIVNRAQKVKLRPFSHTHTHTHTHMHTLAHVYLHTHTHPLCFSCFFTHTHTHIHDL